MSPQHVARPGQPIPFGLDLTPLEKSLHVVAVWILDGGKSELGTQFTVSGDAGWKTSWVVDAHGRLTEVLNPALT